MAAAAARQSKNVRHLCQQCRHRKARFRFRGNVRADRDHPPSLEELRRGATLCFQCFRSERKCRRAQMFAEIRPAPLLRSPFVDRPILTEGQVAHRRRMLACLHDPLAQSDARLWGTDRRDLRPMLFDHPSRFSGGIQRSIPRSRRISPGNGGRCEIRVLAPTGSPMAPKSSRTRGASSGPTAQQL